MGSLRTHQRPVALRFGGCDRWYCFWITSIGMTAAVSYYFWHRGWLNVLSEVNQGHKNKRARDVAKIV